MHLQEKKLREMLPRLYNNSPFYRRKLDDAGVDPYSIKTITDLERLPFTTKSELRTGYPLGPPGSTGRTCSQNSLFFRHHRQARDRTPIPPTT